MHHTLASSFYTLIIYLFIYLSRLVYFCVNIQRLHQTRKLCTVGRNAGRSGPCRDVATVEYTASALDHKHHLILLSYTTLGVIRALITSNVYLKLWWLYYTQRLSRTCIAEWRLARYALGLS